MREIQIGLLRNTHLVRFLYPDLIDTVHIVLSPACERYGQDRWVRNIDSSRLDLLGDCKYSDDKYLAVCKHTKPYVVSFSLQDTARCHERFFYKYGVNYYEIGSLDRSVSVVTREYFWKAGELEFCSDWKR